MASITATSGIVAAVAAVLVSGGLIAARSTVQHAPTLLTGSEAARLCGWHAEVTLPTGVEVRAQASGVSGSGGAETIAFDLPPPSFDPALHAAASGETPIPEDGQELPSRPSGPADVRLEHAGDTRPVLMREAPALKIDETWYVGNRVVFGARAATISVTVAADFLDRLSRARPFEIWWRGTRRMTVRAVPDTLSPDQFGARCLAPPASVRAQEHQASAAVLHRLVPSSSPRLLDVVRGATPHFPDDLIDDRDKAAGAVSLALTIGRDGLVKECDVVGGQGHIPARPIACAFARRWSRFYPATDATGAPIEAPARITLDWGARPAA